MHTKRYERLPGKSGYSVGVAYRESVYVTASKLLVPMSSEQSSQPASPEMFGNTVCDNQRAVIQFIDILILAK